MCIENLLRPLHRPSRQHEPRVHFLGHVICDCVDKLISRLYPLRHLVAAGALTTARELLAGSGGRRLF